MIVELIGCTGAGKTTLARRLSEEGIGSRRAVTAMPDLVLDRPVLREVARPSLVNVAQDVAGLPFLLGALDRRRDFLTFAARVLVRRAPTVLHKANRLRGVARRVGMYEMAQWVAGGDVVLSDEGTVLLAYHFALSGSRYDPADVERFARLVPLPDLVVHVRAPVGTLVERAARRPDRRRQLSGLDVAGIERLVRRTVEVFDLLAETPPVRDRVLVVDNADDDPGRSAALVRDLADRLRTRLPEAAPPGPRAWRAPVGRGI